MRKYRRSDVSRKSAVSLTLSEMFERFMVYKKTEGLAKATLDDYYLHYNYLMDYLQKDIQAEAFNLDTFRGYIGYMLHDKEFSPMTVNVRIRTIRAFLRYCYQEDWIEEAIQERFKPVKKNEDTLEAFYPSRSEKAAGSSR